MLQTISMQEALAIIHNKEIIALEGCRFDKQRKKGGEIFFLPECRKVTESLEMIQMHRDNDTFDFRVYANGEPSDKIERVHRCLIMSINERQLSL